MTKPTRLGVEFFTLDGDRASVHSTFWTVEEAAAYGAKFPRPFRIIDLDTDRPVDPPNPFGVYGDRIVEVNVALDRKIDEALRAFGADRLADLPAAVDELAQLICDRVARVFPGSGASDTAVRDLVAAAFWVRISDAVNAAADGIPETSLPAGWTPPSDLVEVLRARVAELRQPYTREATPTPASLVAVPGRPGTWMRPGTWTEPTD